MKTYTNTPANIESTNARTNSAQVNNKIDDFGAKIGGARKDLYQAANEWAAKLAGITPDALTKAGGVSKLLHLPNLEKMTEAGAITADQARAALIVWRGIERKPQGIYRADRWAERTRARLEAVADILTGTEPTAENVADIITAARESAEFAVLTAAQWPAVPFTFGAYSVKRSTYSTPAAFRIIGGGYYRGTASTDPADIAAQLREMTAADAEKAAESRAAGPRLGVYHTSDFTRYFIAVENKCEIVLKVCNTYQEATEAARNERAELLAKYDALRTFPALRRSWNRPRVGKEWHAEDVTPEQFAAVLPFKGVEFGNWLNQQERAALLNSAFDGFHDLADLLGIPAAAVTLGGRLNFSFATRGHAGSAAHFDSCYNTINLNKRNGAGCMAHEWLHACDHYAAELAGRGGCGSWGAAFSTEYKGETLAATDAAARRLIDAIRNTDYYTRSGNYQAITGKMQGGESYYTMPCELAARGFEGVVLYLLTKAGGCSDFLVNLQSWQDFERDDAGHRRDCYPYPSDAEAAALLPYYIDFFRALFGRCEVSKEAAEGVAAATLQAQQEKAEADRAAAEKAAREKAESEARRAAQRAQWEREAAERRAEQEREAEERKQAAAHTVEMLREVLTARHFDAIATAYDSAAVYAVAHLEGEIYTLSADIETANREGRAYIESRPAACVHYKRVHNAKRIIRRRYQVPEIRANKWNARELCEALSMTDARDIVCTFADFEKAETWQSAAKLWEDTQRLHATAAAKYHTESTESTPAAGVHTESTESTESAPAEGLQLIETAEGVAVIGNDWRDTYFNKKQIKAHGAAWNKERKQWEATAAGDVASLRAWFALREAHTESTESTESTPAATLQDSGEITAAEAHTESTESTESTPDGVPALPEWLKVGARVRTRGRYMMTTHSRRPEWIEGEVMAVRAIGPDFVELESRDESGTLRGLESVATATAADQLAPIYSASEKPEEPAAIAASYDTAEPETHTESTESTPTRAKAQTYQDQPDPDTMPDDLPADVLKFYEVNRDASDENPAPVCLFWCKNSHSYTAYGSDAHILRDELGKLCGTFTTETEYKYGKHYPAPIDFADIERDELPAALQWLTREGYAVAVFAFPEGAPTLNPAAPDWQERQEKRRALRYSERLELADGVTREEESRRNIYDGHHNIQYRYYRGGELLALFNVSGYPGEWDSISTLRPPHAGHFSTGSCAARFGTIYEAERFMLAEIAQGLQPYHRPTDPTPDPLGEGVGICHSYDTAETESTESTATPSRCHLYAFSFAERCPKWATCFRNEEEAAEWLRRAANGTGALDTHNGAEVLKAAPDCLIWYSRRNSGYYCQYVADKQGRPLHGTIADYRALLLYYRKRHILEHVANDIRKAVEMGCTFVVSTADHRARVEVKRDDENGIYIASWYVGDERDSTRAHLHAIEAAEMVYTFREGYAYDLEDIQTTHKKTA